MAEWSSFVIQVPGADLLKPVREILETLLIFLEILKTILETIKQFLIDFGNPIRALVEALIKLIEELFLALKATGFFAYIDVPNPTIDPEFNLINGGFPAFTTRFKQSLFDSRDFNRPQPRQGSTKSGFVLLVVDASDPFTLIRRIRQLLRFFGKELTSPRYNAPTDFRAGPVGSSGDPLIDVASVFTEGPIETILLSWTLPSTTETPDPGFQDAVAKMAAEFNPPNFLIEKSEVVNPAASKIDLGDMGSADATGLVEFDRPTNIDASMGGRFDKTKGVQVLRREPLRDTQGDLVIKFQKYIKVPVGVDILGQLGTYRYLDTDVEVGKRYFYRVRPYDGDLAVDDDGQLINPATSADALKTGLSSNQETPVFEWPSETADNEVVMGEPSGIVEVTIPEATDFDVLENLFRVFLTAFSLDFHVPLPAEIPEGGPPMFDTNGDPIDPTPNSYIGRGTLTAAAAFLGGGRTGDDLLGYLSEFGTLVEATDAINRAQPVPYQNYFHRLQARRLADVTASALLQANAHINFRDLMRASPPTAGPINLTVASNPDNPFQTVSGDLLDGASNMEDILTIFVQLDDDGNVNEKGVVRWMSAYDDIPFRKNVLTIIQFLKSYSLGGIPPDWISIVPLRDIIPWAGQFLYDLLDKIDALLAAFKGFLDEIKRFIDLLIRKIDALERFIQLLISILDFIEGLQVGAFVLAVPEIEGDATAWVTELDNAGGDIPPSGAGGYSCGIGLAYVAIDITAFKTAFGIIFGV